MHHVRGRACYEVRRGVRGVGGRLDAGLDAGPRLVDQLLGVHRADALLHHLALLLRRLAEPAERALHQADPLRDVPAQGGAVSRCRSRGALARWSALGYGSPHGAEPGLVDLHVLVERLLQVLRHLLAYALLFPAVLLFPALDVFGVCPGSQDVGRDG